MKTYLWNSKTPTYGILLAVAESQDEAEQQIRNYIISEGFHHSIATILMYELNRALTYDPEIIESPMGLVTWGDVTIRIPNAD